MAEESSKSTLKNDTKTLFLIANSFNALVGGLFPLSLVLIVIEDCKPSASYAAAVGVPITGLAALGFYAGFQENKTILNVYSVLTGLVAAAETLVLATQVVPSTHVAKLFCVNFCIFDTGISLAAMALAICLAKKVPHVDTPKASSGLVHCMKYVGYGLLIALAVGFVTKFVDI